MAAVALWMQDPGAAAGGPVTTDPLAYYARWLALAFGGLLVLSSSRPLNTPGTARYVGSLLLAIVGLMLVSGAGELVLLFVGLELISIPICILWTIRGILRVKTVIRLPSIGHAVVISVIIWRARIDYRISPKIIVVIHVALLCRSGTIHYVIKDCLINYIDILYPASVCRKPSIASNIPQYRAISLLRGLHYNGDWCSKGTMTSPSKRKRASKMIMVLI